MVKIWEVDFTVFSGTGDDEPQDRVGSQNLPAPTGDIAKIDPLPLFVDRAGITFPDLPSFSHYRTDLSGTTNASLRDSYDRRSFVTWIYPFGVADNPGVFWSSSVDSSTSNEHTYLGFGASNALQLKVNEVIQFTASSGITLSEWHQVVYTVDRLAPEGKLYLDGELIHTSATTPADLTSGSRERIGDLGATKRPLCHMAYVATYDNILSPEEVKFLYDGFLIDSTDPVPFAFANGIVYDLNQIAISGASVVLFNNLASEVEDTVIASNTGLYTVNFPSAGEFSLYSTTPGKSGGFAGAFTVSSGGEVTPADG